ncbi:MAG: DEAD/DEAH box helicase [Planctomycetes bacterium]|nr:DEAD/DEAH box helicase [Planctomycetota bacterium]
MPPDEDGGDGGGGGGGGAMSRMRELLGPGGPIAARHPAFEERECQIAMAEAVDRAFHDRARLFVEAGTGTGKTFAYLLPALLHADLPDQRVVISTWTRNLQEQLVERDLPMLRQILGVPLEAALVQGRENYVCRRRADLALRRTDLLFEQASSSRELKKLVEWAATSPRGTRSSLDFEPRGEAWAAVRAERGNCLGARSPFFEPCAWQEAKRRVKDAGVLVVNHALLLADLKLKRAGGAVLPPYAYLIVDEAHHLEEIAAEHLGGRVSRAGLLAELKRAQQALGGAAEEGRSAADHALLRARGATMELFEAAGRVAGLRSLAPLAAEAMLPRSLPEALRELRDRLVRHSERESDESVSADLVARANSLFDHAEHVAQALAGSSDERVAYVERSEESGDVALCAAPIEPGPILAKELFAPLHSVVMTSATLAVAAPPDRFSWLARGSGIADARKLILASPFDYRRQVRLIIDPLPEPTQPEAWLDAMIERLPGHLERSRGRAFVLFTSKKTMETVADGVRAALDRAGIALLVQGRGLPRSRMLEEFRIAQPAALFGLASFWEGVDVPGSELSHVILTRLPFPMPDHPLERARAERATRRGQDPFMTLSLPKAVLRFKQGFGRLIRRKDDFGVVTVLDARIIQRRYGRSFLDSLPDCPKFVLRDGEEIALDQEERPW